MLQSDIIRITKAAGFNASVGKTDKEGNYHPHVNAIGKDVPYEWVERLVNLVLDEAIRVCGTPHGYFKDARTTSECIDAIAALKEVK